MTDDLSSTPLGRWITKWLAHQRALGRDYDNAGWILQHLQRFVVTRLHAPDLDQAGFDLWCDSLPHLAATTRRSRQLAVRKFCLFRRRAEPDCFVPDPLYFARLCPYRRPVIIEPQQVAQMLVVADGLAPTTQSPLLPAVMHLAVVILYTAGLRRGELVRLNLDDVEPRTGLVRIRASKFHKSRLVPLSSDARAGVRAYLRQRPRTAISCCSQRAVAVQRHARPSAIHWRRVGAGHQSPVHRCQCNGRRGSATARSRYEAQLRRPVLDAVVSGRWRRPVQPAPPGDVHGPRLDRVDRPLPALRAGDARACKRALRSRLW